LLKAFKSEKLDVVNIVEDAAWTTNEAGEQKLKALIPGTHLDFQYVKEDSPTAGIANYIVASSTDILCVVKRHHNIVYRFFSTSTVNKVVNRSFKAVLVMHQ
jgi:hypothetical protein